MLRSMLWEEFMAWSEYNQIYPFGWEQWQMAGDAIAVQNSSKQKMYTASDIYPWLKHVGNINIRKDKQIQEANEQGMAIVSSAFLTSNIK